MAARFEQDRGVLKQQEIVRPATVSEAEKQVLETRIQSLQNEVAAANSRDASTTVVVDSNRYGRSSYDPCYYGPYQRSGYYYQRPTYYVPGPVIINQSPFCPPASRAPASCPSQAGRPIRKSPPATRPMAPGNRNPGSRPYLK